MGSETEIAKLRRAAELTTAKAELEGELMGGLDLIFDVLTIADNAISAMRQKGLSDDDIKNTISSRIDYPPERNE